MLHHCVILLALVTVCCVAVTPHSMQSMREMRLRARQCVHSRVLNITDNWIKYGRDVHHRHCLENVVLEQLSVRLASGESVCSAMRGVLQRVTNYHRHTMRQREAGGLGTPVDGDGWGETLRLMESAWPNVVPQCQQSLASVALHRLDARTLSDCLADAGFAAYVIMVVDNLE